jgi:hypothetical protein
MIFDYSRVNSEWAATAPRCCSPYQSGILYICFEVACPNHKQKYYCQGCLEEKDKHHHNHVSLVREMNNALSISTRLKESKDESYNKALSRFEPRKVIIEYLEKHYPRSGLVVEGYRQISRDFTAFKQKYAEIVEITSLLETAHN